MITTVTSTGKSTSTWKDQQLLLYYSRFLQSYKQSKLFYEEGLLLDGYHYIDEALQYWAMIAVIEAGEQPEHALWAQVKVHNPGVYKLYEELTNSSEGVALRLQLVLLACEFSASSKLGACCRLLMHVLKEQTVPVSMDQLMQCAELEQVSTQLPLLLDRLLLKGFIHRDIKGNFISGDSELFNRNEEK